MHATTLFLTLLLSCLPALSVSQIACPASSLAEQCANAKGPECDKLPFCVKDAKDCVFNANTALAVVPRELPVASPGLGGRPSNKPGEGKGEEGTPQDSGLGDSFHVNFATWTNGTAVTTFKLAISDDAPNAPQREIAEYALVNPESCMSTSGTISFVFDDPIRAYQVENGKKYIVHVNMIVTTAQGETIFVDQTTLQAKPNANVDAKIIQPVVSNPADIVVKILQDGTVEGSQGGKGNENPTPQSTQGISPGATAGIAVGSVALFGVAGASVFVFRRNNKQADSLRSSSKSLSPAKADSQGDIEDAL